MRFHSDYTYSIPGGKVDNERNIQVGNNLMLWVSFGNKKILAWKRRNMIANNTNLVTHNIRENVQISNLFDCIYHI